MASSKQLVTTQQYAQLAGVSVSTVAKWIRSGKLKANKVGNKWIIPADQQVPSGVTTQPKKPRQKPASAPSKFTSSAPSAKKGGQKSYTVAEFSTMTYLTEVGVTQWLQQGRLKGNRDANGQWQVDAGNLESDAIQRLVRK